MNVDFSSGGSDELLAVSTEKGQVLFCDTKKGLSKTPAFSIPLATAHCQVGGKPQGQPTRIKDFEIISLKGDIKQGPTRGQGMILVTCSSDGTINLWHLVRDELEHTKPDSENAGKSSENIPQVGRLLGSYETGDRVTCLKSFVMDEPTDDVDAAEDEELSLSDEEEEEEEQSGDSDSGE